MYNPYVIHHIDTHLSSTSPSVGIKSIYQQGDTYCNTRWPFLRQPYTLHTFLPQWYGIAKHVWPLRKFSNTKLPQSTPFSSLTLQIHSSYKLMFQIGNHILFRALLDREMEHKIDCPTTIFTNTRQQQKTDLIPLIGLANTLQLKLTS